MQIATAGGVLRALTLVQIFDSVASVKVYARQTKERSVRIVQIERMPLTRQRSHCFCFLFLLLLFILQYIFFFVECIAVDPHYLYLLNSIAGWALTDCLHLLPLFTFIFKGFAFVSTARIWNLLIVVGDSSVYIDGS